MKSKLSEDTLTEQPVIDWLKELGYDYEYGPDLAPGGPMQERDDFRQVLLLPRLERSLRRINPDLSEKAIEKAIDQLVKFSYPNLDLANKEIYKFLTQGISIEVREGSDRRGKIVKLVDYDNPANNEFLVVNQFAVQGPDVVRRPDIVVFVNGIPIAIFELKNPTRESADLYSAYTQLQGYKNDIPEIFKYNQVLVISDLAEAKHGTLTSPWEWFSVWKAVEDEAEKNKGVEFELDILTKGIFHKIRLIDIIKNFIVFEADSEEDSTRYAKKMCLYHQYYGVNKAVDRTLKAAGPKGDKKIGVFWHTQGSGKSLSMVFYVNKTKLVEDLESPTYVFLTDRNDLDNQLYKTFLRTGYPTAKQAKKITDLKNKLRTAAGELIFTTIQKFDTGKEKLSDNKNIIVIADEAHRSQYAKFAGNVRNAIPNASFMGITGTPISLENKDTRLVFGDYISTYQINQAVEDGVTVPIYYEGRLVPLHLTNHFIDEEYEYLTAEYPVDIKEEQKRRFARLEQAVSAEERLEQVVDDIVEHFNERGLEGKGMIVTISRKVAVEVYKLLSKHSEAPEAAVVISKSEDFKDEIQKELDNKELERRFKDPDDPLKLAIVCDMWLTGFDVPHLHTMYIDKPLKNHTLMQAIARVNRIFKDKPGGLVVDYIGIADNLKKALGIYSADIRKEAMVPIEEVIDKMMEKYDIVRSFFGDLDISDWKKLKGARLAEFLQETVNSVITSPKSGLIDEDRKSRFLKESTLLSKLFALAMPHHEANKIRNEVEFIQTVKNTIRKQMIVTRYPPGVGIGEDLDSAIRELISKSIAAEGVIDIFAMEGKKKPNISIFDENFINEIKKVRFKNIAIEVLRKLLRDEIRIRTRKNAIRYKSLMELLENIIEEYENNIINSTEVIERLIKIAEEIKSVEKEGEKLGLSEEEVAFYDAIADGGTDGIKKDEELKELVKELVKTIKRDLTVDWSNNEVIRSRIRANVRLMLLRNEFSEEESERLLGSIFQQAVSMFRDYVPTTN